MKISLLGCITCCIIQSAFCQSNYSTPAMTSILRVSTKTAPQYDMQKINKNLKLDRRLIISGSVLTGTGVAFMGLGCAFAFQPRPQDGHKGMGSFLPFAFWMTGAPMIATGVPLLAVGLTQRHKWRGRKEELDIHAGLLLNGNVGLAMTF